MQKQAPRLSVPNGRLSVDMGICPPTNCTVLGDSLMSEESTAETVMEEQQEAAPAAPAAEEAPPSDRPNAVAFAGFLLGGWLAVMIAFVLFATIAMTIVENVLG